MGPILETAGVQGGLQVGYMDSAPLTLEEVRCARPSPWVC